MEFCIEWTNENSHSEDGSTLQSMYNGMLNLRHGHLSSGEIHVDTVLFLLFKEEISHTEILMKGSKRKFYIVGSRSAVIHLIVLYLASLGRDWKEQIRSLFHIDMSPLDLCDVWHDTFPDSVMSFQ